MGMNELSQRLKSIADMVSPGAYVYDVGCDHAFLPIYLIQEGIINQAMAMDIGEGPLLAAKEHISEAGLESKIETRLSDGLHALTRKEVRTKSRENKKTGAHATLIIAGMGGPLILSILGECPRIRDVFDEIIISPQSQIDEVRNGIKLQRLDIIDEKMVYDGGKFYTIMKLRPHSQTDRTGRKDLQERTRRLTTVMSEINDTVVSGKDRHVATSAQIDLYDKVLDHYGPDLLDKKDRVLMQFLEYEKGILADIINQLDPIMHGARYVEVREQIKLNEYARQMIEKN